MKRLLLAAALTTLAGTALAQSNVHAQHVKVSCDPIAKDGGEPSDSDWGRAAMCRGLERTARSEDWSISRLERALEQLDRDIERTKKSTAAGAPTSIEPKASGNAPPAQAVDRAELYRQLDLLAAAEGWNPERTARARAALDARLVRGHMIAAEKKAVDAPVETRK